MTKALYCFVSKKAETEGTPMSFLCQDNQKREFYWKEAIDVSESRREIYTFTEINPTKIDPIIDEALTKGFAIWLTKMTENGGFEYTPIGYKKKR